MTMNSTPLFIAMLRIVHRALFQEGNEGCNKHMNFSSFFKHRKVGGVNKQVEQAIMPMIFGEMRVSLNIICANSITKHTLSLRIVFFLFFVYCSLVKLYCVLYILLTVEKTY